MNDPIRQQLYACKQRTDQLGVAAFLMGRSRTYRNYPVACLVIWIEPAIALEQISFFYDNLGIPVGYMTWAWLAPDVELRMISDPRVLLHISEWNEGRSLWILDFVALPGNAARIITDVRDSMFPETASATWVRRNADGTVRKTVRMRRSETPKSLDAP